jgi:hypothetical protein
MARRVISSMPRDGAALPRSDIMATTAKVQDFMKVQMEEAQKRFQVIEGEAKKRFNVIEGEAKKALGKIRRFNAKELKFLENPQAKMNATVKQLSKKAEAATTEMKKRFDAFQTKLVQATGMASQAQVRELSKELHRLAKKVEGLVEKKAKTEVRA